MFEEFLRQNYYTITFLVEFLAAVTGVLCLKKFKGTAVLYFIVFVLVVFLCDQLGWYAQFTKKGFLSFLEGTKFETNHWWYTIFWKIGAIVFIIIYYKNLLRTKIFKKLLIVGVWLFLSVSIFTIVTNWDAFFKSYFPSIGIAGAILVFMGVAFYFIEIIQSERILTFYHSFNFYASSAILLWWLITTPLVFYDIYFSIADWNFVFLKWQIYLFANVMMYLTFTISFLCCTPQTEQ